MKTEKTTAQEQLNLIEQTIAQAKENLSNHSFGFIFWGWLVSFTALVNYALLNFSPFIDLNPWFFFPLVAGIGTIVSGVVLKFNPLIFGGMVLIGFPFYSVLVNGSSLLLLYAAVIMVSYLVPGYALKRYRA